MGGRYQSPPVRWFPAFAGMTLFLSRQGNQAKVSGVNKKNKYGHGKEGGNYKDRIPAQKKVKAEKNMSKVAFAIIFHPIVS